MQPIHRSLQLSLMLALSLFLLAGCAASPYININYRLPDVSQKFPNRTVFLDYKDERTDKIFLSPSAQAQFKYFTGIFALTLTGQREDRIVGSFEASSLFKEALKRRLNALAIEIASLQSASQATMQIALKEFFLDLEARRWKARIKFETRLNGADGRTATQSVAGEAERLKSVGRGDAEKVLSEIFTDAVNQININDLFVKLGL